MLMRRLLSCTQKIFLEAGNYPMEIRNKLKKLLYSKMFEKKYLSDTDLYRYILMLAIVVGAGTIHLTYILFFLVVDCLPLALLNAVGLVSISLAYYQLKRDHFDGLGFWISVEIVLLVTLTVLYAGPISYFYIYYFLLLALQLIFPFKNRRIPYFICPLLLVLIVLFVISEHHYQPFFDLQGAVLPLGLLNLLINFLSFIFLLAMDKAARGFLDQFRQQKMEELQDQAHLDPLTGLYNRRYAEEYFEQLVRNPEENREICVAIADLDDFKAVNDTYGHDVGDVALQTVSRIMVEHTRKTDRICRWGGEEFLMIFNDARPADTYKLLEKIRQLIGDTTIVSGSCQFRISITMGMASMDLSNVKKSIETCDRKLYIGKKTGKNIVVM